MTLAHHLSTSRSTTGGGLLLLASYTSIPDAALGYPMMPLLWPFKHHPRLADKVKGLVSEQWNSIENIRQITQWPVLLVHGKTDYEILPSHSKLLLQAAAGVGDEELLSGHQMPGDEGVLFREADGRVWYLEVKHAGHNGLGYFQVVTDTILAWTTPSDDGRTTALFGRTE
ncbi:hypothetical protein HKX48_006046 [Thoreauomyces humboldtii]|nr:hypothetical protein HKX48_006046 [Thoreauomyces humboldtii]